MNEATLDIALMPGDGIGPEVMEAALLVLETVQRRLGGFHLAFTPLEAGAEAYRRSGVAMSEAVFARAAAADAILFGAMGLPDVRLPDGREIAPQLDLRERLGLFAGIRPIRLLPGVPSALADPRARLIDLVILREQTEGLFAERGRGLVSAERAEDRLVVTRAASERLFDAAFALARERKARRGRARVDLVDKANVLGSMAFFRSIFLERAARCPDIEAGCRYVDATALDLVRRPWDLDVLVTENLMGDILSDLGAGLVGGMGFAPTADLGEGKGLFQPAHGSAPDIAGQGIANPTAMILSAAMMLDWLGTRRGLESCRTAARLVEAAVERVFAHGRIRPVEQGGSDGTRAIAEAVAAAVGELEPSSLR
ncbi:MAG: isocitrate/isopropylmalate family dehydrogenase [Geminicoccaceae bacterium]|nr:isocitrate/isopropylmalate family dehydrogenase [Geminicoccaceae bacterium]